MDDKIILLPYPREMLLTGELTSRRFDKLKFEAVLSPEKVKKQQGYHLKISKESITILAYDEVGLFYADKTLKQIVQQFLDEDMLPCLEIEDWPDFPVRGIMLDISRDKIPTMDSLYALIDMMSSWKINQLQLYIEHAFAYQQHATVWKDSSPLTAEQAQSLDSFCRDRFIELVPIQNSFGHMHRWLKHEQYKDLAELSEGWGSGFTCDKEPFTLCPTDSRTMGFLNSLYDELLPNFSSRNLGVGLDETLELGKGKSKAICQANGVGRVYLDFLNKLEKEVSKRGHVMMYFGDVIIKYPELIAELPRNAIVVHWGYGAHFPYDKDCRLFAEAGIPFYVAPSNSTYRSVAGRTKRAIMNIRNAVANGLKHGAIGVLNTEWGDCGHWQPQSTSYLGFAYGAALSWAYKANENIDISEALSKHVFLDKNSVMGELVYDIGNLFLPTSGEDLTSNLHEVILNADMTRSEWPFNEIQIRDLQQTKELASCLLTKLSEVDLRMSDSQIVLREYDFVLRFIAFVCDFGLNFLCSNSMRMCDLSKEKRILLNKQLDELISIYRDVWSLRNREGGLADSLCWYDKVQKSLQSSVD